MERIAAFIMTENDRLHWRAKLTEYFRASGDWSVYALTPSVILPGVDSIDTFFDIGDGVFHYSGSIRHCGNWWTIGLCDERLSCISPDAGIFVSRMEMPHHEFGEGSVKVAQVALFEIDGYETRIIKKRPLGFS